MTYVSLLRSLSRGFGFWASYPRVVGLEIAELNRGLALRSTAGDTLTERDACHLGEEKFRYAHLGNEF